MTGEHSISPVWYIPQVTGDMEHSTAFHCLFLPLSLDIWMLILTAELPAATTPGGVIFTSTDSGKTFRSVQLPFHPAQPIAFHHQNPDCLLVICTQGSPRAIYVSLDNGDRFTKALLPSASSEQFYSVLDGDEDMIFMHVDSPGDETYFGTVYTSDDRGILYSKSLERHLFGGERKSDFTNVTSLRGVYLTNVFEEDGRICTVITYNSGGKWWPLKKPKNVECGENVKKCNLHIHGEHSHYSGISPMLPLSHPSAVGLIIAHGSVGDSISASRPDVFVSTNGGYSWICALKGPHHYSILDSGGLIVAVEVRRDRQTNAIKSTLKISVFGYRPDDDDQPLWVAVTIDFEQLLTRECGEQDYVKWLAHSDGEEQNSETDGCVLGFKETFLRLKKMSVCRKGHSYTVSKEQKPCPCSREDYMCDYGYYVHENSSECVQQPEFINKTLDLCFNGELKELQTTGHVPFHIIPSDKCEGGFSPPRQIEDAKMHCGNSSQTFPASHQPNSPVEVWLLIVISVSVGIVSLAVITAVFLTVLRKNYRHRSPSYQFSALQLHEDEMCVSPERTSNSTQAIYQEDLDDVS
ncbi:Sortilin [Bagarius yarrelli]|uniref:Sortilin n=1 Tax=Bagarius yarrelli TaxID=175774 RepID=A0A556V6Z7_BAGYA|nr:Sortilin [Bagarius yarrelli]